MLHRKKSGNAIDGVHGEAGGRRRGVGPFSGAQLTVIIVAIVVMVMLPVGAFAVSGTNSFITDATSGKQAIVNSSGALLVAPVATTLVASGTATPVAGPGSVFLAFKVNTAPYTEVRLTLSESGANTNAQIIDVFSGAGTTNLLIDTFSLSSNNVTRVYDLPGSTITIAAVNGGSLEADYTWALIGRST